MFLNFFVACGVRYEIWFDISRPMIFISNWMEFNFINLSNGMEVVNDKRNKQL